MRWPATHLGGGLQLRRAIRASSNFHHHSVLRILRRISSAFSLVENCRDRALKLSEDLPLGVPAVPYYQRGPKSRGSRSYQSFTLRTVEWECGKMDEDSNSVARPFSWQPCPWPNLERLSLHYSTAAILSTVFQSRLYPT